MKYKVLLLLMFLVLLCGCNAKYNVVIKDNSFYETLDAYSNTSDTEFKKMAEVNKDYLTPIHFSDGTAYDPFDNVKEDVITYNKSLYNNGIIYTSTFDNSSYKDSYIVKSNLDSFNYLVDSSKISINSSSLLPAFEKNEGLETLEINIECHYNVLNSNADKVSGNTYTWIKNISNADKTIYIEYDTSASDTSKKDDEENQSIIIKLSKSWKKILYVIIGIISLGLLVLFYAFIKSKENNKI